MYYNYFQKSRPVSYGWAGIPMDIAMMMVISAQSSRLQKLTEIIKGLNIHEIDSPRFQASTDLPADALYGKTQDAIVKSCIEKEFDTMATLESLALENHDMLRKCLMDFDKATSSTPVKDYRSVCNKLGLSVNEYKAAERSVAKFLLSPDSLHPENRLMIVVSVQTTTGRKQIIVPEPVTLRLVSDIRRERAAQGRPRP